MDIRPIHTKSNCQAALARIEKLMNAKSGSRQEDELEVLSILVERYEEDHYPVCPPDPVDALKFRMEQEGLTRKDLEPLLGGRNRVSEILNHKRNLSLAMIRAINRHLRIPAEILLGGIAGT